MGGGGGWKGGLMKGFVMKLWQNNSKTIYSVERYLKFSIKSYSPTHTKYHIYLMLFQLPGTSTESSAALVCLDKECDSMTYSEICFLTISDRFSIYESSAIVCALCQITTYSICFFHYKVS